MRKYLKYNEGLAVPGAVYVHVGYFSCQVPFEISLQSFGALCKISDVNIFKRAGNFNTLLLQFSSDLSQTYEDIGYHGGIEVVTFLGNPPSV